MAEKQDLTIDPSGDEDSTNSTVPISNKISQYVKLNVGGHLFQTTIATLTSQEGMLRKMFEGNFGNEKDSDGYVMIDRDGEMFSEILNFLRRGSISLARSRKELENILAEAEFYQIEPLISMIKKKLSCPLKNVLQFESAPRIFISCDDNAYFKFKGSSKPVIHLKLGKNNTYPSMADEVQIFRNLFLQYKNSFIFSLELSSSSTKWLFLYGDEEISSYDMSSNRVEYSPITKLLAYCLENSKEQQE